MVPLLHAALLAAAACASAYADARLELLLAECPLAASANVSLWPVPTGIRAGVSPLALNAAAFQFVASTPSADLTAAFARASAAAFQHASSPSQAGRKAGRSSQAGGAREAARAATASAAALSQLTVSVANLNVPLQLGVDESYNLTIPADGSPATLTAATVYGAYHGLTTFAQLVGASWDPIAKSYTLRNAPYVISDGPRFAWRGLMIDSDRHFLPVSLIFRLIDSMTLTKLNVLHWHIVDEQAWPLESEAYPLLWSAAWSSSEKYTFEDVAAVVEYARQRGVRVMVEFDTPGHAGSMCTGYPEICPSPTCTMPLNPAAPNNVTFTVIQGLLQELAALFPDTYMHLGGDEVDTSCWTNTPSIVSWMASKGFTADQTYEYMVAAVDEMALGMGKYPVRWEEVWAHFGTQLDKNTIIHAWLSNTAVINATSHGYRAINSVNSQYYLPHLTETWQTYYDADILAGITDTAQQQLVLGGEVAMWGEWADPSDIMATIYPRAAAAAERWWSYSVVTGSDRPDVPVRFADFRCWMHTQGVGSAPIRNAQARAAPPGPGSCRGQ